MEPFSALLISNDAGSVSITQKVMEDFGVCVKVVPTMADANRLIKTTKFDLAVLDNDVQGALQLVAGRTPIANPKILFGLVRNTTVKDLAGKRVHFIMQKPLTAALFARSLSAAYGPMIHDRRVAFRHPVQIKPRSAMLVQEEGNQALHEATILDLSQNGLCIQTQEILPKGVTLQIEFEMPESKTLIHVTGRVMWTRASGRTGIEFTQIPAEEQKTLVTWLDSMLPYMADALPRQLPATARQD
ncbi:MAG TPA: PilZ domain-containing protein [Candidatus Angelobacter sp.]|nr:PilZ domain-containing protein [Candidatus Angelobacter sp.]